MWVLCRLTKLSTEYWITKFVWNLIKLTFRTSLILIFTENMFFTNLYKYGMIVKTIKNIHCSWFLQLSTFVDDLFNINEFSKTSGNFLFLALCWFWGGNVLFLLVVDINEVWNFSSIWILFSKISMSSLLFSDGQDFGGAVGRWWVSSDIRSGGSVIPWSSSSGSKS